MTGAPRRTAKGRILQTNQTYTVPAEAAGGILAWNSSNGLAELDFWNLSTAPVLSHRFLQRTIASLNVATSQTTVGTTLTFASVSQSGGGAVLVGMTVSGSGIASGCTVAAVTGTTVTLSSPTTSIVAAGTSISFPSTASAGGVATTGVPAVLMDISPAGNVTAYGNLAATGAAFSGPINLQQVAASLMLYGAGSGGYGFGVSSYELTAFIGPASSFALRSPGYAGPIVWKVDSAGNATTTGTLTVTGTTKLATYAPSIAPAVSAAGNTPAAATALAAATNIITSCAFGAGVILPVPANPGQIHIVRNRGTNALLVYPQGGAVIEANAPSAGTTIAPGAGTTFIATTTTSWTFG